MPAAVSTVCAHRKIALKNLYSREYEALIPLAGISAVFCKHTWNTGY